MPSTVNDMQVAIEAKTSRRVTSDHLKGLRQLQRDHNVGRRILVSLEAKRRTTDDGVEILPARTFARLLAQGQLF